MQSKLNKGFSLIELMIAILIGIIFVGLVLSIFINNKKSYTANNRMVELNSNIRFALSTMKSDLDNVGFYGGPTIADSITAGAEFSNKYCSSNATLTSFPIWGGRVDDSHHYVSIKGVYGKTTDDDKLYDDKNDEYKIYIRATESEGNFIAKGIGSRSPNSKDQNWQYYSHYYYVSKNRLIRESLVFDSTNNNSFCETHVLVGPCIYYQGDAKNSCKPESKKASSDSADMQYYKDKSGDIFDHDEAGIEAFYLLYGVDENKDGIADFYTEESYLNAAVNRWINVISLKIYLLARSAIDHSYTDEKKYILGDLDETKDISITLTKDKLEDAYHRKVFTATVLLKTPRFFLLGNQD